MPGRKLFLTISICLNVLFSGCNFQGVAENQDQVNATREIELTGTALAISGVLETPDFALLTPTALLITPSPIATPLFSDRLPLAAVMIKEEETLNVRSAPGDQNGVVATLSSHAADITNKGNSQEIDGETWIEIQAAQDAAGWVRATNLTEQVSSTVFCSDQKVTALIGQFLNVIQARDGEKLAQLGSPRRGLIIRHEWWNPEVRFQGQDALENIFSDSTTYDWGIQDGSGQTISGSFKDEILPKIDDVQVGSIQLCNNLEQGLASGGSAGFIQWPNEYANFNYIAIYRAAPEGDELNWRTWVIGIEYVNGNPYVAILVQYHWEI